MKRQSSLLVFIITLFLNGCGSAWIIQQDENGGMIGYKRYSSSEDAAEAIKKLIHCLNWKQLSDEIVSGQSMTYMPIANNQAISGTVTNSYGSTTSYQGTISGTEYMPMMIDRSYRVFTYSCGGQTTVSSNKTELNSTPLPIMDSLLLYENNDIPMKFATIDLSRVISECDEQRKNKDKLLSEIKVAITEVAVQGAYSHVVKSANSSNNDLTEDVITKLNKK